MQEAVVANTSRTTGADGLPDYEVGRARPPKHSQFKPGVSGNPHGRPKRALTGGEELRRAMNEAVIVTEDGQRKRISKLRLAMKQFATLAAKGEPSALKLLFAYLDKLAETGGTAAITDTDQELLESVMKLCAPKEGKDGK
jgi:hypothetical protein